MRWFRKRSQQQAAPGSDAHMMATLEELGVPLDVGVSDPSDALTGGFAKATIYQAHLALQAGNDDQAIAAATAVIEYPGLTTEDRYAAVAAVAFHLRGAAHEAAGSPADARADYERALARAPEHTGAREGLTRVS